MPKFKREYISTICLGATPYPQEQHEIVIALYGPRGGTLVAETLSIDSAKALRDSLNRALEAVE